MPRKIFKHGAQHFAVGQAVAEHFGRQAGERQQAIGTFLVREDPAERRQRQRIGVTRKMVGCGGLGSNCKRPD